MRHPQIDRSITLSHQTIMKVEDGERFDLDILITELTTLKKAGYNSVSMEQWESPEEIQIYLNVIKTKGKND